VAKRAVNLTWEGKAGALGLLERPAPPIVLDEAYDDAPDRTDDRMPERLPRAARSVDGTDAAHATASHRIIRGDALDTARALRDAGLEGQVDVVYLDPPYGSGVDYRHEERLDGNAGGRVARTKAYGDRWDDAASYLDMLLPRLLAMRPLLGPSGSIWIQVDWRASYLVRSLCDEVFGCDRFLNEIVWRRAPNLGRQARSGQFGRTLDTLIVYGAGPTARLHPPDRLVVTAKSAAKKDAESGRWFTLAPRGDYTDASIARLESEGRVHKRSSGALSIKYWLEHDDAGRLCKRQPVDALWIDIPPLRHAATAERTGYPTQKPLRLLERVIACASPPGGLVVDLFAGSGTTGAAAAGLGRRFVLGDQSPVAIATMRSRLLRQGVTPLSVERCTTVPEQRATARLEVHPHGSEQMEVLLECDGGVEPIAWTVSLEPRSTGTFRADWHAERGTGRRPAELARRAVLPRVAEIGARVYFVDGSIADARGFATAHEREPTWMVEGPP